jgi:RNA polymerase sigma-54 factor
VTQVPSLAMAPQLGLRPSRMLVASMQLLALPTLELERMVERELAENPALERRESPRCPRCGAEASDSWCRCCGGAASGGIRPAGTDYALAREPTLAESLRSELIAELPVADRPIAEYLLGSLDEHGFIDQELGELANALCVAPERVRRVLRAIQRVGPPGVGARDVAECLLLQVDAGAVSGPERELVREIVAGRLDDLAHGRYGAIARALHVDRAAVTAARDVIRARLRPYPTLRAQDVAGTAPPLAPPEILVREDAGGALAVELLEQRRLALAISPSYESLDRGALSPRERAEADAQIARGRSFLSGLERRWSTVRAVAEHVVERQHGFVVHGPRALRALTRAEVAEALGFHESTVSRAVAGRHAMLPSRRVVPLAAFFDAAAAPRDALAQVVAKERRPLTDTELAAELTRAGFPVARRTVAKYRDQLGIPAQALR